MQRWGVQLQFIDGEAFARIKPLLVGKRNALDVLLDIMSRGDLYFRDMGATSGLSVQTRIWLPGLNLLSPRLTQMRL